MISLESFLPVIRRQISGPLDFMMTDAALEAAITFCRESTIIRSVVELDGVIAGQPLTLIDTTAGLRPFRRLRANDISNYDPLHDSYDCQPFLDVESDYEVIDFNTISFRRNYSKVRMVLAMEPTQSAEQVPDILFDQYAKTIACGALEQLFIQPDRPWTDEQRSAYYKARFTDGFRDAYRQALDNSPYTGFHNPVRRHEFF